MLIQFIFDEKFRHENVDNKQFQLDVDPQESVDYLKTLITLRYTDVDPETFHLQQDGKNLANQEKILNLMKNNQSGEILKIQIKPESNSCCTIF